VLYYQAFLTLRAANDLLGCAALLTMDTLEEQVKFHLLKCQLTENIISKKLLIPLVMIRVNNCMISKLKFREKKHSINFDLYSMTV
jgi:hypothetical protein